LGKSGAEEEIDMVWKWLIALAIVWLLPAPFTAQDKKVPAVTDGYARVEVRATLVVGKERVTVRIVRGRGDLSDQTDEWELDFGTDEKLWAAAGKLHGTFVVVTGDLGQRGFPSKLEHRTVILVKSLKAAVAK
jgi:hypothetical protein